MAETKRKKTIIANWKMNFTMHEASIFLHKLSDKVKAKRGVEVVLAPSIFTLQSLSLQVKKRQFKLAAQNFYWRDFGAFTGEVSIAQLKGIVDYGMVGHSERRHIFGEQDKDLRDKVAAALRSGIQPILCIGETANEREFGETGDVIYDQLVGGLTQVTSEDMKNVLIAYEPVWAISTTQNAKPCTPEDAEKAVEMIREHIRHLYGKKAGDEVRVLFGGSVDGDNAAGYLGVKGVDGALVGGASLKVDAFNSVVEKANALVS
ncbi:triose-phosphate isomerase [Candidatus Saccharibacteria bacterium]|nr:triose-phosphate isomerase [Candidatus Saccharibacteria bacterium]